MTLMALMASMASMAPSDDAFVQHLELVSAVTAETPGASAGSPGFHWPEGEKQHGEEKGGANKGVASPQVRKEGKSGGRCHRDAGEQQLETLS